MKVNVISVLLPTDAVENAKKYYVYAVLVMKECACVYENQYNAE